VEHIELITKIIEAEEHARQLAEDAKHKRDAMQDDLKASATGLRENYFERAEARLKKVREQETIIAEEKIAELDKTFERDAKTIEDAFEKNHDAWADKLFNIIVGESA
jgi:vacuolar-type H+-ATPase subunit H